MSSLQEKNIFGQKNLKIQRKFKEMNLQELEMKGLLNFNEEFFESAAKVFKFQCWWFFHRLAWTISEYPYQKKLVYNLNLSSLIIANKKLEKPFKRY
jgi:hypothetical protein